MRSATRPSRRSQRRSVLRGSLHGSAERKSTGPMIGTIVTRENGRWDLTLGGKGGHETTGPPRYTRWTVDPIEMPFNSLYLLHCWGLLAWCRGLRVRWTIRAIAPAITAQYINHALCLRTYSKSRLERKFGRQGGTLPRTTGSVLSPTNPSPSPGPRLILHAHLPTHAHHTHGG